MQSAIVRVTVGKPENPYRVSHLIRQRVDQLTREGGIPTFEKTLEIIKIVLKDGYRGDTAHGIVAYVIRMHLLYLARKEKLNTTLFQEQRISIQKIYSDIYSSARKFSSTRRKLEKVRNLLKPHNIQALIDDITATNGHGTHGEPPLTLRRAPVHRRPRTLSYA